jgi:urease accessory protein
MPPFSFDGEPEALLYLINLTAGLMDGDGHLIEVEARAGTSAVVTGQSATRVHPALKSFATQQWKVVAEEDACLVVLPGPTIPFRGCRYFQRGRVELASSARLIWGDIWVSGRYDRGELSERFVWERMIQDFEVRRTGRLIYRDRFQWEGPWKQNAIQWHFGGHLCSGSLFIAGEMPDTLPDPPAGVLRSVFPLDHDCHCIRWCGHPMPLSLDVASIGLGIASHWKGAGVDKPWLLGNCDVSPNHWFSTMNDASILEPVIQEPDPDLEATAT